MAGVDDEFPTVMSQGLHARKPHEYPRSWRFRLDEEALAAVLVAMFISRQAEGVPLQM